MVRWHLSAINRNETSGRVLTKYGEVRAMWVGVSIVSTLRVCCSKLLYLIIAFLKGSYSVGGLPRYILSMYEEGDKKSKDWIRI